MGSLYQRSDGYWVAAVVIEGRRVVRYDKTESGAQAKLADLERQVLMGQAPPVNLTVGELLQRWLDTESTRWKPRTAHDYRRVVERLIAPALGRVRLAKLSVERLQRFFNDLSPRPRQANTVYRTLHRAFVVGVRWGYLSANPCDRIVPPAYRAPRAQVPTADAFVRLLDASSEHRLWPWLVVAVTTGMRPGEQAALRWSDVDPTTMALHVRRSGMWLEGRWVETEPKTSAGLRAITLGAQSIAALERQRELVTERQRKEGSRWVEHDLVFPGQLGRPIWLSSLAPVLRRLCDEHGLPPLTLHKLRHLHASLLLGEQVPLPLVSRRLGHANPQITASIYSHAIRGDELATIAIERALSK